MPEGQRNLEDCPEGHDFENLTASVPLQEKVNQTLGRLSVKVSVTKRQHLGLRFGIMEDLVTL
jgi:hypothetical protein